MKLNYKEGMFLGKQELERQNAIAACFGDSVSRVIGRTKGSGFSIDGVFNPKKLGLKIEIKTVNNVQGIAVTAPVSEFSFSELGRAVVGQKNGSRIGVVSDSDFTGKECFLPLSSLPIEDPGYNDTMLVFRLKPATTNYENALITIDSTGQGTIIKGWDFVKNLFREATGGRASTIKTSGNQILKVASVDIVNQRVQFEGVSFTAETAVQFMFVQTLSPFVTDVPQPLYTYDTCEVYCDGVGYGDYEDSAFAEDNVSVPIATAWIETESLDDPEWLTDVLFENNSLNFDLYPFLDTLGKNQVKSLHILDGEIITSKIRNNAVTSNKIGPSEVRGVNIENLAITASKIANQTITSDKFAPGAVARRNVFRYTWGGSLSSPVSLPSSVMGQIVIVSCPNFNNTGGSFVTVGGVISDLFSDISSQAQMQAKLLENIGKSGTIFLNFASIVTTYINRGFYLLSDNVWENYVFNANNPEITVNPSKSDLWLKFDYVILPEGLLFESQKELVPRNS